MAVKTKDRILQAALALFNQLGESNVTTHAIAEAAEISSGNLHYHFPAKKDLVTTLFAQYEHKMLGLLATPPDRAADLEDMWLLLHLSFELMGEYEFIFRDVTDLCQRYSKIDHRFKGITQVWRETILLMVDDLVSEGLMDISPNERRSLIESMLLVSIFWLTYDRLRPNSGDIDPNHAVSQVMTLLSPYLIPEAQNYLRGLLKRYH